MFFSKSNNNFGQFLSKGHKFVKSIKGVTNYVDKIGLADMLPIIKEPLRRVNNGLEKVDNSIEHTSALHRSLNR